jgi:outer membrane lipoprotein-sorting protein
MLRRSLTTLLLSLLAEPVLAETPARRRHGKPAPRRPRTAVAAGASAGAAAAGGALAAGQAQPEPAVSSTAVPRGQELPAAEAFLNRLVSLKARFLQLSENGATAQGTAWIVRPGRMRFEYDPPDPMLLVANGGQFFYLDRELRQPTIVPTSSTPLGLLLRENMSFASNEVTVTNVENAQGFFRITLHRTGQQAEGRLTLVFADDPCELRQWEVVDAQGRATRVTLSGFEYGVRYPSLLFEFNNPIFREQLGIQ